MPADKSSFGHFEQLAQQNKQVIQKFLEKPVESEAAAYDYDAAILKKLRDQYASCLNEEHLNDIGDKPLRHIVKTIRKLFREEDTDITAKGTRGEGDSELKFNGLTAAVSYLHTRGAFAIALRESPEALIFRYRHPGVVWLRY